MFLSFSFFLSFFPFFLFIYVDVGGERILSRLSARKMMQGSISQTVSSWPEPKSRVGCLNDWATQVSLNVSYDNTFPMIIHCVWLLSFSIMFLRFIYFVACISTSFLWLNNIPLFGYKHSLCIHQLINIWIVSIFSVITNSSAMKICV